MNRRLYPANWDTIALQVKTSADWTCRECSRPCRRPGESDHELITRIETEHTEWAQDLRESTEDDEFGAIEVLKLTRFTLTTAHLNHEPSDCSESNLKALCSVCHCRMDLKAMGHKRRLKAERLGQLNLFDYEPPLDEQLPLTQSAVSASIAPPSNPHAISWHEAKADFYLHLISRFMNGSQCSRAVRSHEITRLCELRSQSLAAIQELSRG